MKQSILIVEDEIAITNLLKLELREQGYDVTATYDGFSGLETARTQAFDLILLDWMLPGITGIEICQRIRKTDQLTPIVFLTSQAAIEERIVGLDAGADDYIIKPFGIGELFARVRSNIRRTKALSSQALLEYANLKLDRYQRVAYRDRHEIELTSIQFTLLEYFLLHPEQVVTYQTILAKVWNRDHGDNYSAVEICVRRLRKKLEVPHQERLIQTKRGIGYVLRRTR